jgi:hypothetical protein
MNYTNKPSRFNNRSMALMGIPDLPEAAFGGDLPPMHRKALVQAMGIRPQGGGGGGGMGLMAVVGIAAAIVIPFAAPAIAASLATSMGVTAASFGLSAAVGGALGSALVGAGLGAVTAAAMGQNVGKGALFGGIGGGIGGYMQGADAAAAASGFAGETTQAGMLAAQEAGMGLPSAVATAPGTGAATTSGLSTGFGDATTQSSMLAAQEAGMNLPQTQQAAMLAAQDAEFGTQLSNAYPSSQAGGTPQFTTPTYSTATGYQAPTAGLDTTAAPVGTAPSYPSSQAGGTPAATTPTGAPAPTTGTTTAPKTFMETLSQTGTEIKRKFTDPKSLADLTLRAAGMMAGSAIAGDGLSDQERALLDAQTAELQTLQSQNQALFNEKLNAARDLIGESKYFDPEYFGLQSARRAQTQVATAKRAGLSGLTGERRQAEERRYDIAGGRATGTAYDTGFQTGVQGRLATEQAGLSAFPSQYPNSAMSGYSSLMSTYGAADRRREQAARQVGSLFGGITGVPQSRSLG